MHDEHLKDFYAGLAMLGLVTVYRDDPSIMTEYAKRAFDIADAMVQEKQRREENANEQV